MLQIVSAFLLADIRLWKSARIAAHSFFKTTFPFFNDARIFFFRLLAELRPQLMEAFVADDCTQEYSDSCLSLGFRFFASSPVARTLFADGLAQDIVQPFVTMIKQHCDDRGTLSFDRSLTPSTARRFAREVKAHIFSVHYLLHPSRLPRGDQWTDALRRGFVGTFTQLLRVMEMMEGTTS